MTPLLNAVEHANFFAQRATEYSKGATRGDWNSVWSSPIVLSLSKGPRQGAKAKAANEAGDAKGDVARGRGCSMLVVARGAWRRSERRAMSL